MDFYVVLGRAGERVAKRRRAQGRVGFSHRVTAVEAIKWFQQKVCIGCLFSDVLIHPFAVRRYYSAGQEEVIDHNGLCDPSSHAPVTH